MAHHNTVFGQLLTLLPRHEFDAEARDHQPIITQSSGNF